MSKKKAASEIGHMKTEHLMCRDLGHNWTPHSAFKTKTGFERSLMCRVCKCLRSEELDRFGTVMSRQYRHQAGYLMQGQGRITADVRGTMRVESILRLIQRES